jgi:hypothetical protein
VTNAQTRDAGVYQKPRLNGYITNVALPIRQKVILTLKM